MSRMGSCDQGRSPVCGGSTDRRQDLLTQELLICSVAALPVPEEVQELIASCRLERFFGHPPEYVDGLAHLFEVGLASGARYEVLFEPHSFGRRERIFQIVGNELHQLSAAQLIWNAHLKSGSRSSEVLLQRSPNPESNRGVTTTR